MYLIAGLGNPGIKYEATRHNIGFMVIDNLSEESDIEMGTHGKALAGRGDIKGADVVLLKPLTFMNLSGAAVGEASRALGIEPSKVLVIFDDCDLPLGTIRLKPGGGSGGQKGVASIIEALGTSDFPRLRIGIGRPELSSGLSVSDYVLSPFAGDEGTLLEGVFERTTKAVEAFLSESIESAMNKFN